MADRRREWSAIPEAGWSWGWVSAIDSNGQTIWIVDAHRDDGKRFVVHADEVLTAFMELESANQHAHHGGHSVASRHWLRCLTPVMQVIVV